MTIIIVLTNNTSVHRCYHHTFIKISRVLEQKLSRVMIITTKQYLCMI